MLAILWLIASAGCATVETAKPAVNNTDRSAAGGAVETGDPAAPADKAVISAADDRADDPPPNKPVAAKPSTGKKDSASGISETRERRLREVAADFDRRRDEAQYQAALNRWREDDGAGCREALAALLGRTPGHCAARLLLADVELSQGNPKAALEQARQVLALEPKNAEAHHVMGLSLDALGETTAAISHYEQATRLDSENEQYAACYHAALDASIPPHATATDTTPSKIRTIPSDGMRPENIASGNPADSKGYTDESDGADRITPPGGSSRVVPASAFGPVESGSDESPDARQAVTRAADALRNDHPQSAVDLASDALVRHPKSASLYRVLGASQYRLGNYAAAQVAIAQALSLDKSDALAYFLMGSTLARLGQSEAAERQFAEAARLDPRFGQGRD